ncbi:MAG: hypothetical protein CMF41_04300 [Legionellales bacterium]|nr:hypothetical protein [Legionellales bacterium]|tara:strand:- start:850 stop:1098 length:249 start_codon:yes stop_codon:yes gene_type:complete
MDALKLYNLQRPPSQQKELFLPKKKAKYSPIQAVDAIKVKYICYRCNKSIELTTLDKIKCVHCESRVIKKEPDKKLKVYNCI